MQARTRPCRVGMVAVVGLAVGSVANGSRGEENTKGISALESACIWRAWPAACRSMWGSRRGM
ncbi:hypothetical protein [Streptomyces sp. GbtcB6]|uniref:hypothetical protein n=1 Tax=Streptomyces sp. GbtcB6 TaxID=2824751 RepID=UPI001C307198|nr:hypothetical protein [Streptomyces sp. GbtcB6]